MSKAAPRFTFSKRERIVSRKLMDQLFGPASRSLVAYPLRVVYLLTDDAAAAGGNAAEAGAAPGVDVAASVPVQVLVSVPKRHLRHAVDRNRVKRQVREAYRLNNQLLAAHVPEGQTLAVAFVWLSPQLADSQRVAGCVKSLLHRLAEKL